VVAKIHGANVDVIVGAVVEDVVDVCIVLALGSWRLRRRRRNRDAYEIHSDSLLQLGNVRQTYEMPADTRAHEMGPSRAHELGSDSVQEMR